MPSILLACVFALGPLPPATAGGSAPDAAAAQDAQELEACIQEAEGIERSMVALSKRLRASTVSVMQFVEVEQNGKKAVVNGGVGSGVILSRDGLVMTNVHVIANAVRVEIVLTGGERVEAEILSQHKLYDFALLRAKGRSFQAAEFAKTKLVKPGQWAIACGNPRGLALDGEPIVTLGIISGLGRLAGGQFDYQNAIQTDAEINPGNSGGPLFDLSGRVIGINGKIATLGDAVANVGVGYTIPGDQVQAFMSGMRASDEVVAGYSGLQVQPQTHADGGVLVTGVTPGSPAQKVGIRVGDRVTQLNGKDVDSYTTWLNQTAMLPNGRTISLRLVRDGKGLTKKLTLQAPQSSERK